MLHPHPIQVSLSPELGDRRFGQHHHPILPALGPPDYDLPHQKIDVFDPKLQYLQQPQTPAVHEKPGKPRLALQLPEHRTYCRTHPT